MERDTGDAGRDVRVSDREHHNTAVGRQAQTSGTNEAILRGKHRALLSKGLGEGGVGGGTPSFISSFNKSHHFTQPQLNPEPRPASKRQHDSKKN